MSEQTIVAIIGCIATIVLMLIRVPIAVSLGIVAVAGFAWLVGPGPALGILMDSPIRTITNFNFSVIPMFVLMGALVSAAGMSRELFRAANAWVGHLPGGMAIATIFACGGFGAINGSSVASAATMTQVALPEMRRVGYDAGFSAGVVAAGGTLGIMIPPSVMFILYAILTDTDVTQLFIAGILPGLLAIALYCLTVLIVYYLKPAWLPLTPRVRLDRALDEPQGRVGDAAVVRRGRGHHVLRVRDRHGGGRRRGVRCTGDRARPGAAHLGQDRGGDGRFAAHQRDRVLHPDRRVPVPVFPGDHAIVAAARHAADDAADRAVGRRDRDPGVLHHRRHVRGRAGNHPADHPDRVPDRHRPRLRSRCGSASSSSSPCRSG